ncbi:MAG: biotin--[acetyl-CoA-carboxylase] ligase [Flavobacteriaceae bacterium]|nr:biotin--[acetyl-CoA-carboxylase] ligase [Flavobacteriaceae bacterium]
MFPTNTRIVGHQVVYLDETDSTNLKLAQLLRSTAIKEGFVLRAGFQQAGKGQAGNVWNGSPESNLLFSVLLKPNFLHPSEQFSLSMAISLAVYDFVDVFFPGRVKIKWSNDLLLDGKKVCGILIENTLVGNNFKQSIVGIGLNVNQDSFTPQVQKATSFMLQANQFFQTEELFPLLVEKIEARYQALKDGWTSKQREEYLSKLFRKDEEALYIIDHKETSATIRTVDESGQLGMEIDGQLRFFAKKEIAFVY